MQTGKSLYENTLLRSIALPILKAIGRDVSIKHHWTGRPLKLNLFTHKGYWYHGRSREKEEMLAIQSLVTPGDMVVEVGGHIGYITLLLSQMVAEGSVTVFEPGSNNLPYIRTNVADIDNIALIEKGCGSKQADMMFHEDNLTGQNNSFVNDFRGLESNTANAPNVKVSVKHRTVSVVRLDEEIPVGPAFVKIDVEGFEFSVLQGAGGWFAPGSKPPIFMIEVQADHAAIADWFHARGYELFDIEGAAMSSIPETTINLFALVPDLHVEQLRRWRAKRGRGI